MVFHHPVVLVRFLRLGLDGMVSLIPRLINANHWNCCHRLTNSNSLRKQKFEQNQQINFNIHPCNTFFPTNKVYPVTYSLNYAPCVKKSKILNTIRVLMIKYTINIQ